MEAQLKLIDPAVDKRWDAFVDSHPKGSIYHSSVWSRVLERSYGYTPSHLAFEEVGSGRLVGVIPFQLIKSRLTGKRLVSLPLTSYCERLFPESGLEQLVGFVYRYYPDIDYLELKLAQNIEHPGIGLLRQSSFATHILALDPAPELLFKSFHSTSVRQRIRRAERNNLKLRVADQAEDMGTFFRLYRSVRKKHGLPPQPYIFFKNMWCYLKPKELMSLLLIEFGETIVAAAIVLRSRETLHFEYSASDHRFLKLCPNQKLIWESIKMGCRENLKYFDFGRSLLTHRSLIEFKERWGAQELDLVYYYYPVVKGVDSENGFGRKLLSIINRGLPGPLLQLEGRLLYPHLG